MSKNPGVIMYAHGSSYNHGCEAIVRSTVDLLSLKKDSTILYSDNINGDKEFGLDDIVTIREAAETPVQHNSLLGYYYRTKSHFSKDREKMYYRYFGQKKYKYLYEFGKIALSIGGDNYCYRGGIIPLQIKNYWLTKKGFKTILWGASLMEEFFNDPLIEDLNRYSLITVRESYSLDLLKKYNIKAPIIKAPDPAFTLKSIETQWKDNKEHKNIIGINISPYVILRAKGSNDGINNYINLIRWILKETDAEIALIPHVTFPNNENNDATISDILMKNIKDPTHRIIRVGSEYNCCQLKSLISKCTFFVGARTHATIAAYSSFVPTLVIGYSSKSIGIARDLFGTDDVYVVPVQEMSDPTLLLKAFKKLYSNKEELSNYLKKRVPEYLSDGYNDCQYSIKELMDDSV